MRLGVAGVYCVRMIQGKSLLYFTKSGFSSCSGLQTKIFSTKTESWYEIKDSLADSPTLEDSFNLLNTEAVSDISFNFDRITATDVIEA